MRHLPALAVGSALLLLTGCAVGPAVDLDAARTWLEDVQAEESDGPGAAASAAMLIGAEPAVPADGAAGDDGVRLDFAQTATLKRADARCFGGGTAEVSVTVFSADGTQSDSFGDVIACDEEPHGIDLGSEPASAVLIDARTTDETYLHVTVIETTTVER